MINKNYGKNINLMEKLSGKLMDTLIEEAVCFGSLKEYSRAFVSQYKCGYKHVSSFMTTLRLFAVNAHGKEWYKKNFNRGEQCLQETAKYLGVEPKRVIEHISKNKIDLISLSKILYPDDYVKVYNFFYTRCARFTEKN